MTVHDQQLEQLGTALRAAVARDIHVRTRRRRRVLRWSLVPVLGLSVTGAAFAISPLWGEPAPPEVQGAFDQAQTVTVPASAALPGIPAGTKLTLWAADGDLRAYGTRVGGETCLMYVKRAAPGDMVGTCRDDTPAPGGIRFDLVGDGTVSGQVTDPTATSVSVALPGDRPPVDVRVGFEGWFVAQLSDTPLVGPPPPGPPAPVTVTARDADGAVVAQASTDGR
jgi:hypothetical protein